MPTYNGTWPIAQLIKWFVNWFICKLVNYLISGATHQTVSTDQTHTCWVPTSSLGISKILNFHWEFLISTLRSCSEAINIEIATLRSWKSWNPEAPEPEILKSQRSGAGNFEIRCAKQWNRNPETEILARGRRNVAAATLDYFFYCKSTVRVTCFVRHGQVTNTGQWIESGG